MQFPQLLWRIGTGKRTWMIRRGNDSNEPIEKFLNKDIAYLSKEAQALLPVGVLTYCELGDDALYSTNHPWDWLNEEGYTKAVIDTTTLAEAYIRHRAV